MRRKIGVGNRKLMLSEFIIFIHQTTPVMKLPAVNPSFFTLLIISTLSLIACKSPQKLQELGDYDGAVYKSLKKLKGKKIKEKFVVTLEESFRRATQRDMREADLLENSGHVDKWPRIHSIHRRIQERQSAIEPYLPVVARNGYKANFRFVRIDPLEKASRKKAADYIYNKALNALDQARQGDRQAARTAYYDLERAQGYFTNYKDSKRLLREAEQLGLTHILLRMENRAPVLLPWGFERALIADGAAELSDQWNVYYTDSRDRRAFDYELRLRFDAIDVSPNLIDEQASIERREIRDGWQYVLDSNGNVAKDSLGNDIKEPRYVEVQATIVETLQSKFARVAGYIEFYDVQQRRGICTSPFELEAVFEHNWTGFVGDERALSDRTRRCIDQRPVPYPTDEDLLLELVDQLHPVIEQRARRVKLI